MEERDQSKLKKEFVMDKRQFLTSLGAGLIAWPSYGSAKPSANSNSPALLTLTGAIGLANRGPVGRSIR